jgi:hypothetical protein
VGLFRQQLIRFLACLVAIELAVGVVALYHRSDRVSSVSPAGARSSNSAPPSAGTPGAAAGARPEGVLAGGSFSKRRSWRGQSTSEPPAGQTGTTAPARPSTASSPSTRLPALPAGGSTQPRPRPAAPAAGRGTTTSTPGAESGAMAPPTATTDQPAPADRIEPQGDAAPPNPSTTGSSATAKTTAPSYSSGVWTVIDDPTGDTVVDSSRAPQANAAADVVQSRATNTTKAIGFAVKVAQPADPTRDPNWNSPATFVLWEVDTSGDGNPDYEIEYFLEGGKLIGGVSRLSGNGRQAACEAEAGYTSESYLVGIDPACLGSPASLSYRATVFYGTDPNSEDSVTDVAPDGGMTGPVRRTAA